jgi:2,4-dienoyl-CoA reductase-like NADH-dependent reductase (Old Yellow Enzyme family)/thioredoxin reductase
MVANMSQFEKLLSPIRIGGVFFKNRLFAAPTGLHALQEDNNFPSEAAITHFEGRARAGAACVTCVGASILPLSENRNRRYWDIYHPNSVNVLAQLARRIRFFGANASMELGTSGVSDEGLVVSEGAPTIWGAPGKGVTRSDIQRIAEAYANGALVMKQAGFDMILLHFGHGLQVGQFLSPLTNKRRDEFGGSFENRTRFPIMIIDAIRASVGRNLLIEVRISGREYEPGGIETEEAIAFTKLIEDKIDIIHVSAGMHNSKWMTTTHPCGFLPPTPNIYLAEAVKKAGVKIPVAGIGGISDLNEAEQLLVEGKADILESVRGFIADNRLMQKAYENRPDDVVPCVKCMRCHDSVVFERHFSCTVNPEIGLEHKLSTFIQPPRRTKRVAVIGGGPAGIKAALVADGRGHEITLFEKKGELGGNLRFADFVSFKYPLMAYKNYMIRQQKASGVLIRLNTDADAIMLREGFFDAVLVATGSHPIIPPISGIDGNHVLLASEVYGRENNVALKTVVIGGGQVGCETALHLAMRGHEIAILEMRSELAPDASPTHRTELLNEMKKYKNLTLLTDARCLKIEEHSVQFDLSGSIESISANSVILAAGLRPDYESVDGFLQVAPYISPIGDCAKVSTVEHAVRSAFFAAAVL